MSFPLPDVFNDAVGATAADLRDEVRREFAILPSDSSLAVDLSVKPAEVGGADYHSALRADGPFPPLAGIPTTPFVIVRGAGGVRARRIQRCSLLPLSDTSRDNAPVLTVERHCPAWARRTFGRSSNTNIHDGADL